jgi:hypothetical protein
MVRVSNCAISCVLVLCMAGVAAAGAAPPDLTGLWTMQPNGKAGTALNGVGDFQKTAPFSALARGKVDEYNALVDPTGATPAGHCVAHGMPLAVFLGGGYPVEFVQRPEQLIILYEGLSEIRRVFLDGRKIDPADLLPSRGGTSWGHWEGDTLVVETISLKESIDQPTAHSENARIIERYTPRVEGGLRRLHVEVTLHDPEFYTRPPVLTREYTQLVEGRMLDYNCTEQEWLDHVDRLREARKR